jgi:hypothetical protein
MTGIQRIFFKLFIKQFYAINAGYFLFFFILFFGVVNPADLVFFHVSIMLGLFNSPVLMAVIMLLWLLYFSKCVFFGIKTINKPENNFLTNLQAFSFKRQWALFFFNVILLYLPVLIYSCFVVALAFKQQHAGIAFILIGYQLIVCSTGAFAWYFNLNMTAKKNNSRLAYVLSRLNTVGKIRFPFYLLTFTAFHRKITFFCIKLFSMFVFYILFVLNRSDFNFINFNVIFLIVIMAHAILPFYYISFMERDLSFYRNLPVPLVKTGLIYIITYCIVLIPELLFLLVNALDHVSLTDIFLLYGVAVVNLLLFTALLYMEEMRMKEYFKIVFAVFFVSIFALHFKNFILLISIEFLIATLIFINSYHLYESKAR